MNKTNFIRRPFLYANWNVTLWLISANVLIFALRYIAPNLYFRLAMIPAMTLRGAFWQPFTYMFVHGDFWHILFNMLGLLFFGTAVERDLGSREFLLYYMLTGFLAGLFSLGAYFLAGAYSVILLGASGAVYAVLLAFAVINPQAQIYIWGILPVRAPIMVLGFIAISLVSQFTGRGEGVAHLTHLAGIGFGWLYFLVRLGVNPAKRFFGRE